MPLVPSAIRRIILVLFLAALSAEGASAQLVGYWPFSGNYNDQSGNGHHGINFGTAPTADRFGNPNSALLFNGITDYVMVPDHPDLRFASIQEFTISFWMKSCITLPLTRWIALVDKGPFLTGEYHIEVYLNNGERVELNTTLHLQASYVKTVLDGKWHHVVCTFNTPNSPSLPHREVWVDGQLGTGGNIGDPLFQFLYINNTDPVYFGRGFFPSGYYKGALDDVRFYNRVLSGSEIMGLYTENGWPNANIQRVGITASVINGPTTICPGDSVQLGVVTTGPAQGLIWQNTTALGPPPHGMRASDTNMRTVWVRPSVTTLYRVQVSGAEPCPDDSAAAEVTVVVRDGPWFPRTQFKYICAGDSVDVGDLASGGFTPYTYRWEPASGIGDLAKPIQRVAPAVSTNYYLTVTDVNGCRARDTNRVVVISKPSLSGIRRVVHICRGSSDTIGVDATGGNGRYRYKWSPAASLSGDTLARPEANPSATTRYIITVTDAVLGCVTRDSVEVVVHERPVADAGVDIVLCRDSSVVLGEGTAEAGVRYSWSPSTGLDDPSLVRPTGRPLTTTTYRLTATEMLSGCSSTDMITVFVPDGTITPLRDTIDFGELDGCTTSREESVDISNLGTTDLTISSVDITLNMAAIVSPVPPFILKPGTTTRVIVRYAPGTAGVYSGQMRLHGSPCGVERVIELRGTKLNLLAATNPSSIDFGVTPACATVVRDTTVRVFNNGTAPMDLGLPQIATPFRLVSPAFPVTIPPGDSIDIQLQYNPTTGTHSADMVIPYQSGTCTDSLRVKLAGVHELPRLTSDPPVVDVLMTGCTTQLDTTISLANNGALPVLIDSLRLPVGWRVVGSTGAVLLPGESMPVTLRFEPGMNGTFNGAMQLFFNPCNQEIAIELRGMRQGPIFAMPDTIDFGEVIFCNDSTVQRPFTITYLGDSGTTGAVASVLLGSPFSTTLAAGALLGNGQPQPFALQFAPSADGDFSSLMRLRCEPCGVDRTVVVRGSRSTPRLLPVPPVLDFGVVSPGTVTQLQQRYVNSGTLPVTVERIDGITPPFVLVATVPPMPATLPPGDTLVATVDCSSRPGRSQSFALAVTSLPCVLSSSGDLRAQGARVGLVTVSLPQTSAAPGDRLRLPLTLESGGGSLDSFGLKRFEAVIGFNRTMLVGLDGGAQTTDATTGDVHLVGERRDTSGVLADIELLVALGNAETTPLVIRNFRWLDPLDPLDTVVMQLDSGEFRVEQLCRTGVTRLVNGDGMLFLRPVRPNPAGRSIEIEYGIVEQGPTELVVFDMQGRRVATLVSEDMSPGHYIASADVGRLGSGRYRVVLRTPTSLLTTEMEIAR